MRLYLADLGCYGHVRQALVVRRRVSGPTLPARVSENEPSRQLVVLSPLSYGDWHSGHLILLRFVTQAEYSCSTLHKLRVLVSEKPSRQSDEQNGPFGICAYLLV